MDKSRLLRIWEISALVSLCVCLCAAVWAQGRSSAISADLVRLHVLAVSDDAYEQTLKLRVRDAVLEYITPRLDGSESPADARAVLSRELDGISRAAASAAEGRQVTVSLGTELYPSREYEGFTLPAGRYESLRVVLGEGEGHNWWCIVFPPVCLSAVQSEQVEEAMSVEDYALITRQDGYELRFRTVELWGELLEKLVLLPRHEPRGSLGLCAPRAHALPDLLKALELRGKVFVHYIISIYFSPPYYMLALAKRLKLCDNYGKENTPY